MTKKDIDKLVNEFMSESTVIADEGNVHKITKPKSVLKDKKPDTQITHNNQPQSGGNVVTGDNAQIIHNHKVTDYKIDNSAINQGRAAIGPRKRGERVDPTMMTPKEYSNYLFHKFSIPGKKGWNGIERSDYAQNWEPDETQNIKTREEALKYIGIAETKHSPDGVEKRESTRRKGQKDYRQSKIDRRSAKQRRKDDLTNNTTYFITMVVLLMSLISWVSYSVILHIEGLAK
jgi:hypothetical protein